MRSHRSKPVVLCPDEQSVACAAVAGEQEAPLRAKPLGGPLMLPRTRGVRAKVAADLRAAMTLHRISQRRLAHAAGVSRSTIEEYLGAESGMHVHVCALLAASQRGCRRMVSALLRAWADDVDAGRLFVANDST